MSRSWWASGLPYVSCPCGVGVWVNHAEGGFRNISNGHSEDAAEMIRFNKNGREVTPLISSNPPKPTRWIAKVMVSADGGNSWALAALDEPALSKALTRFRAPWRWDGQPVVLQSRAWDEAGNAQPTRAELFAERGEPKVNVPVTAFPMGHMNMITSWSIDSKGEATHVYA